MPTYSCTICGLISVKKLCPTHQAEKDAAYKASEAKRGTARQRGYDAAWERKRKAFLAKHPTCLLCPSPARVGDHHPYSRRELVAMGVTDPDAEMYLRPLCVPCHSSETGKHQPGGWNRRSTPATSLMPVVAVFGPIASGKSTLAQAMAQRGYTHLSIDATRKAGGTWEDFIESVRTTRVPTVAESVVLPAEYRAVLDERNARKVYVSCPEHVRIFRVTSRGSTYEKPMIDNSRTADHIVDGTEPFSHDVVTLALGMNRG